MVGSKPVANAQLVGDDATDRARRLQLLTQIADDDPQVFDTWFLFRPPARGEHAFVGHHASDVARQYAQYLVLLSRKVELFPVAADDPSIKIDAQIASAHDLLRRLRQSLMT